MCSQMHSASEEPIKNFSVAPHFKGFQNRSNVCVRMHSFHLLLEFTFQKHLENLAFMQLLSQYVLNCDHKSGRILDTRESVRDGTSLLPWRTSAEMTWWSWSHRVGTFLAAQWLRPCSFNTGAQVRSLVWGLRSHLPCSQKKRKKSLLWSSGLVICVESRGRAPTSRRSMLRLLWSTSSLLSCQP